MQEVVMVLGFPASGKTTVSGNLIDKGYAHLNRDKEGGKLIDLLPKMVAALSNGQSVVLDNLFPTAEVRKSFIEAATLRKVPIRCVQMDTKIEDASINALHRMWDRYGKIFFTPQDIKNHKKAKKDSNMFPIVVLFKYKKEFEKPTKDEGFVKIEKHKFERRYDPAYNNKALILDYDDTLRTVHNGDFKFPTKPEEVKILAGRAEKLKQYEKDGYLLLGVSNQSGIARKQMGKTEDEGHCNAKATFDHTNKELGVDIDYRYCPDNVPPRCYCRKPQSGLGVALIRQYDLDPRQCIFVGDQTSDKTFATRLSMQYSDAEDFFDG